MRPDGSRLVFLESPAPPRQQGAPRLCVSALPKRGPPATGRWRARRWRTPPAQSVSGELSWLGPGGPGTGARTLRPPPAAVPLATHSTSPPKPTPCQARRRRSRSSRRPDLLEFQHKGNPRPQEVHHQEGGSGRGEGGVPPPRQPAPPGAWTSRDDSLGVPPTPPQPETPEARGALSPGGADPAPPPLRSRAPAPGLPWCPSPGALPDSPPAHASLADFPRMPRCGVPRSRRRCAPGRGQASPGPDAGREGVPGPAGRRGPEARFRLPDAGRGRGRACCPGPRACEREGGRGPGAAGLPCSHSAASRVFTSVAVFKSIATANFSSKVLFPFPRRAGPRSPSK